MIYSLIPKIKYHAVFSGVSEAYADKYFGKENTVTKRFSEDTVVYSSKSRPIQIGIIIDGVARVYVGATEESTLLRTLHSGDIFGIANLYDEDEPFPSKIIAATDTNVLFISGDKFKEFVEGDVTALQNYLSFLTKKIVYLNKKITTFTAGSAEKKLALFMLDHAVDDTVTLPCTVSQLADLLQMGRASLYRAIDSLIDCGAIVKQSKNVYKISATKLKNI